jgi:hypothetical protein
VSINKKIKKQRYLVLELTVQVEEIVSKTLGLILDIEWKESKSLGYSSSVLSFNQKVMIIQDIKGIDKLMIKKLDSLMFIRNKFAHIKEVSSFESLFTLSKGAVEIKKNLEKWYYRETDKFEDEEEKSVNYFIRLVGDAQDYLIEVSKEHVKKKGFIKVREEVRDEIMDELISEIRNLEGGDEKLEEIWRKLSKKPKK